jgi:secondary thiamine-phosphate synthase enzyme
MIQQHTVNIHTKGRGFYEITALINDYVINSKFNQGICSMLLLHTSASLVLCENADEAVKDDLENFFSKLVPDNTRLYSHTTEGKDDMPAHIRTLLTKCDLTVPIARGILSLGTWQGIYIWEHRLPAFRRQLIVTLLGE